MTLTQYYKAFISLFGLAAAVPPVAAAVISPFLPDNASAFGFPPMGDVGNFARLALVCLAIVVTLLVYFWHGGKWLLVVAASVSFICMSVYVALYPFLVLRIDVPSSNTAIRVSVGYERSQFAKANFNSDSNEDMLRARGTTDEEVKKLWTFGSLTVSRLALLASYCGFILGLVAVFSLAILFDLRRRVADSEKNHS